MKHIVGCSFGKDSLAMVIKMREAGMPIDEIIYCRIMFNDTISAEYPIHEKWIHEVAIPKLESWGLKVTIVQSKKTYCDYFYQKFQKGKRTGEVYGFPSPIGGWCNDRLKVAPINSYLNTLSPYRYYVGIAADETRRILPARNRCEGLPLVDMKITEKECFEICRKAGLLSPLYESFDRLGCWFCHKSRNLNSLRYTYRNDPDAWKKLLNLEKSLPEEHYSRFFGWDFRLLSDLDEKFKKEVKE